MITPLLIAAILFGSAETFPKFINNIPNGNNVPHPCSKEKLWKAIGHELPDGPGPLTQFGIDFKHEGNKWTQALCKKDSDGDGRSNGEELGDPLCNWRKGESPTVSDRTRLSNPAVCEPMDSDKCRSKNTFLQTISACRESGYHWCPQIKEPEVMSLELKFDDEPIPDLDTVYYCKRFTLPDDDTYHIIAYEVINDNPEFLHHMLIMACITDNEEENLLKQKQNWEKTGSCGMTIKACPQIIFYWGPGTNGRCYRIDVGFPMGNDQFRTVILQNHFNNPDRTSGIRDSSGIRLYYTKKPRQNEAAMIAIGQMDIAIPPKTVTAVSSDTFLGTGTNCGTSYLKGHDEYKVTGLLVHIHKIGTHVKVELVRSTGQKFTLIDKPIEYEQPPLAIWSEEDAPTLHPGDDIITTCTYDSRYSQEHKHNYTFFGQDANDEMCFVFMEIFPRPNNLPSQQIFNVGDMNQCLYYNVAGGPEEIHGCADVKTFNKLINNVVEDSAEFVQHCQSQSYPAERCTKQCYLELEKHGFLNDTMAACMKSLVFRYFAGFHLTEDMEGTYYIQTHADKCIDVADISETVDLQSEQSNNGKHLEKAVISGVLFLSYIINTLLYL